MRHSHQTARNTTPDPAIKSPARLRALYLLREFVLEPLLTGVAVMLLLGGLCVLAHWLQGGPK